MWTAPIPCGPHSSQPAGVIGALLTRATKVTAQYGLGIGIIVKYLKHSSALEFFYQQGAFRKTVHGHIVTGTVLERYKTT